MDKRNTTILDKISKETLVISEMITDFDFELFADDEKTKRAVCMTLINIGELVKLLPIEFRQANPSIPWRSIAGLRDVAAHGYQTLCMEDIWETVTADIPILQSQIKTLLGES
jgi:uncharacterized protein with HEPN domain